ncbi:hypothetical protein A1O3_06613 [Capronia epimyces CBS 606.96]|uniref:Xylanolytic transcriptional activator regulatory domain-containing protein n=1 Tax=Capronia epimyces CBS 606.96 TaxID=1182542 RepID=W9XRE1_9EURO|nr:uncharacterized protein A1O3_06613 [Capronia epimyces CBS 606.96]EXJ82798.1 hypothetical protein A1O3_06613 [Capronia epimyces CBS 606.96]
MDSTPIRPTEVGSLAASDPNESEFLGSSSGVFFINTVFRTFGKIPVDSNQSGQDDDNVQEPEIVKDYFFDSEISSIRNDHDFRRPWSSQRAPASTTIYGIDDQGMGVSPPKELAREMIQVYFRTWHPLFPFLHGPSFLDDMERLYTDQFHVETVRQTSFRQSLCRMAIYQCVFNISALGTTTDRNFLPPQCRIDANATLLSWAGYIATAHDLLSLQALLAMQLYFLSKMFLRDAAAVGGLLFKTLVAAGFHRCPFRSAQLSAYHCDMRKRVFWSAYAIDRYLSQALGMPFIMSESDIDICPPGTAELHRPVRTRHTEVSSPEEVLAHLPLDHPTLGTTKAQDVLTRTSVDPVSPLESEPGRHPRQLGQEIVNNFVACSRLTSQTLSLFHKAIRNRVISRDKVLDLTSEVHAWWNALPNDLQEDQIVPSGQPKPTLAPFFKFLYHHSVILINRPFLSLPATSPDFRSSLQTCINSSRAILRSVQDHVKQKDFLPWPGLLAGVWTAGLVLALACKLRLYPLLKTYLDLDVCLSLLQDMGTRWANARRCHASINMLLDALKSQAEGVPSPTTNFFSTSASKDLPTQPSSISQNIDVAYGDERAPKRQRYTSRPNNQDHLLPSLTASARMMGSDTYHTHHYHHGSFANEAQPDLTNGSERFQDYTGPSFDIDIEQFNNLDRTQIIPLPVTEGNLSDTSGVFGNLSWDFLANGRAA